MYQYTSGGLGENIEPIAAESDRVMRAIRRMPEGRSCPVNPSKQEQRIKEQLEKQGFNWFEIEAGLRRMRGEWGVPPRPVLPITVGPPQTSMREISRGEQIRNDIYTAKVLEQRFRIAERTGDIKGMEKAAKEYYELLNRYPSSNESMPGRGQMERHREEYQRMLRDIRTKNLPPRGRLRR